MKPTRPSTTNSLRWLRRSGRWNCPLRGRIGSIGRQSMPDASSRFSKSAYSGMLREPMWSNRSRTFTPRSTAPSQGLEEGSRHVVPGRDVELDLDALGRTGHVRRHGNDGVAVARDQVHPVAGLQGQRAEVEVEGRHRGQVRRPFHGLDGQEVGGRTDRVVSLSLTSESTPSEVGPAQEQEDHEARERDDQDQDQPGHGGGRLAVVRQHSDGQDLDDVVGDDQDPSGDEQKAVHYDVLAVAHVVGMSAPPSCDTRAPICT